MWARAPSPSMRSMVAATIEAPVWARTGDPADPRDGRLMARPLGAVFALGPLTALGWLLFADHPAAAHEGLIAAVLAAAAALGLLLLRGAFDERGPGFFACVVGLAGVLVSLVVWAGATPVSGYPFGYLWATPYAYVFLSRRQAALQTAIAGSGLTAALSAMPASSGVTAPMDVAAYVLAVVSSVVVVGLLAGRLAGALRASDRRFASGFQASAIGAAVMTADMRFVDVNAALSRMLGREPADLIGTSVAAVTHPEDVGLTDAFVGQAIADQSGVGFEKRCLRGDGEVIWVRVNTTPVPGSGGADDSLFAVVEEITARKRVELDAAALARDNDLILRSAGDGIFRIDTAGRITYANPAAAELLGWPQESLVGARAHDLFHHSRPDGTPYPLDECPIFNATLGGDVHRSSSEVFWRANGNAFPVDYTAAPMRDEGEVTGAVCVFADITETLVREADLREELELQQRITRAIATGDLLAYSQPIVALSDGERVGEELLVRLRSENPGELILPADFLPQAERSHLMPQIDRHMLRQGLALARVGRHVAVNLSAQSILDPGILLELEREAEINGHLKRLTLEITETSAVENMDAARRFAERARALGCRIALDDFGTGFGAFSYLRSIEIDYLKIDLEFVREVTTSRSDERIVRTLAGMAHELGIKTIAEGVEDEETRALLTELGVDFAQGYLLGRPAPVEVAL